MTEETKNNQLKVQDTMQHRGVYQYKNNIISHIRAHTGMHRHTK